MGEAAEAAEVAVRELRREGTIPPPPGSENTARAGTPYRDREATPQRERGGAVQEYGTRYGSCNNCGEEGHYAYECKKPPRKNAPARHTSSEK